MPHKLIAMGATLFFVCQCFSDRLHAQDRTEAPQTVRRPFHIDLTPEQAQAYQKAQEERLHTDWAYLERYRETNAKTPAPSPGERRVVFLGDLITENWGQKDNPIFKELGEFFPGKGYLNRGISGQTTPQMLLRLRPDVIDLGASVMLLLAGTNDIAGITGPKSLAETESNIRSMKELAEFHGIRILLCSVPPAKNFWWHPSGDPSAKIIELNQWINRYASEQKLSFVDYYALLVDKTGDIGQEFSIDGVHPNGKAYALMGAAVEKALTSPDPKH